jgi:uncharacterized protein
MHLVDHPWPWYVAGPLIGLTIPALLLLGNRSFGISSAFRHICAACFPGNISFFQYDWKKESWNLFLAAGIIAGGFIAANFLSNGGEIPINPATRITLQNQGVRDFTGLLPTDLFSFPQLSHLRGWIFTVLGGLMVGFGTRYAGGCTSGHTIMGISSLQWPSLVATICFMIGGLVTTWFLLPWLLQL